MNLATARRHEIIMLNRYKSSTYEVSFLPIVAALYIHVMISAVSAQPPTLSSHWAEIRVVDAATGRGIPLVELETTNSQIFVTDNAGRVAFHEPGLLGRQVFFYVKSHGYEVAKDGFGFRGVRVTPQIGKPVEIKMTRRNVADRLCRLTGEGLYRDSVLLGYMTPLPDPLDPGKVAGQDSVQTAIYHGRIYWLWGDTLRMEYPLGLFRMAGATTPIFDPNDSKTDPAGGIAFNYFVGKDGFARAMMPLPERPEGVVWIGALCVVPDADGKEKLVAHYSRRKGLGEEYEQGIAIFDNDKEIFKPLKQLPLNETWRHPSGHPIVLDEDGTKWLLFGSPTPNVRVKATLQSLLDPSKYEAFTCVNGDDGPKINANGKPGWRWQKKLPPTNSKTESAWVKAAKIKPENARFCPADANHPSKRIVLHSGTVRWNKYRRRWVMLAGEIGGNSSLLGEVWYAEADHPTGPFTKAVKVVTHDRQTFYNVCHHAFLDRDGGRTIHFEGTYTNDFSGNPHRTPRYNYNQMLYRLDLDAPALKPARGK